MPEAHSSARMPWRGERPPHLPLKVGEIAPDILLPGDPDRVTMLASQMTELVDHGRRREYAAVTGRYHGRRITICSSGIGGPSTEIALVELAMLGARRIIRIGGMSALVPSIAPGSFLGVVSATGGTGAARSYSDKGKANSAPGMALALVNEAAALGYTARTGIVGSTDSYYAGQDRPLIRFGDSPETENLDKLVRQGVHGVEMEAETVLVVCSALGLAGGALLCVHGNRATDAWLDDYAPTQEALLPIAVGALERLDRIPQQGEPI